MPAKKLHIKGMGISMTLLSNSNLSVETLHDHIPHGDYSKFIKSFPPDGKLHIFFRHGDIFVKPDGLPSCKVNNHNLVGRPSMQLLPPRTYQVAIGEYAFQFEAQF